MCLYKYLFNSFEWSSSGSAQPHTHTQRGSHSCRSLPVLLKRPSVSGWELPPDRSAMKDASVRVRVRLCGLSALQEALNATCVRFYFIFFSE